MPNYIWVCDHKNPVEKNCKTLVEITTQPFYEVNVALARYT